MKEAEIRAAVESDLKNILEESGIYIKLRSERKNVGGIVLELKYGNKTLKLAGELCSVLHFSKFNQKLEKLRKIKKAFPGYYPLLIGTKLSPDKQAICKENNISYMDLTGSIFVRAEGILIDIRGKAEKFKTEQISMNPFADKASLVLRILLKNPGEPMGIRELAGEAGISPGWVSQVSKKLHELDYLVYFNDKIKLVRTESLIKDWTEFYKYKKNRIHSYYISAADGVEILEKLKKINIPKEIKYAVTLQAGAYLISPHAAFRDAHIYLPGESGNRRDALYFWREKLKLEDAGGNGNFHLMEPYYANSVFFGEQKIKGLCVVSDIQAYLDLKNYPLRGEEQAEHLFNKKIKPAMGKNKSGENI